MQERRETFHDDQDGDGQRQPKRRHDDEKSDSGRTFHVERALERHAEQHFG